MRISLSRSPSISLETGTPVHLLTTAAISSPPTSSLSSAFSPWRLRTRSSASASSASSWRSLAVAQLGRSFQRIVALGLVDLDAHLVDLLAQMGDLVDGFLLALPAGGELRALLLEVGQLSLPAWPAVPWLASSFSLRSASRSISNCMISRSISSSSWGLESISMCSRLAASSIRSMALSGRKRSVM